MVECAGIEPATPWFQARVAALDSTLVKSLLLNVEAERIELPFVGLQPSAMSLYYTSITSKNFISNTYNIQSIFINVKSFFALFNSLFVVFVVPPAGVEPARAFQSHLSLSQACLPLPSWRHFQ